MQFLNWTPINNDYTQHNKTWHIAIWPYKGFNMAYSFKMTPMLFHGWKTDFLMYENRIIALVRTWENKC